MAILNDYNQLIREHFDISDPATRKTIVALEDTEQTQLLAALSSALYDKIVQKVDQIDFGTIPRSRGDITKVEGFENTVECLNIIRRLVMEYKENPEIVDTVLAAIENIKSRKGIFMKAFSLNIELPMVLYNLVVMSIEQSVSFLIATCIQYIKDPASQNLNSALDKVAYNHTRDNLLFEQLAEFNKACLSKDFDNIIENFIKSGRVREDYEWGDAPGIPGVQCIHMKSVSPFQKIEGEVEEIPPAGNMKQFDPDEVPVNGSTEESIKGDDSVNELAVGSILAVGSLVTFATLVGLRGVRYLLKVLIPMIRNITYFCINLKVKLSDSLAIQAQLIEANAYKLQYSTTSNLDDDKKKKVVEKQLKWAERLKKWSNTFAIDNKKAEKETKKMIDDDIKQKTIEDIKDQLPPDIADKGGLFAY